MAWDSNKSKGSELTSSEWDTHVSDQKNHAGRHEKGGSDAISSLDPLTAALDANGQNITNVGSLDIGDLSVGGAEAQASLDGLVVPVAPGLGVADAIDPSATSTPVQDALDSVAGTSQATGAVLLPPTNVTEGGSITPAYGCGIIGWGREASQITFTATGSSAHGIHMNTSGSGAYGTFDGFRLIGPGNTATTGAGWRVDTGNVGNVRVGSVGINNWGNAALDVDSSGSITSWSVGEIRANVVTPETSGGGNFPVFNLQGGPGNSFATLYAAPSAGNTGNNQNIIRMTGGSATIGSLNIGGQPKWAVYQYGGRLRIRGINYEPSSQNALTDGMNLSSTAKLTVDQFMLNDSQSVLSLTNGIRLNGATEIDIGRVLLLNGASLSGAKISVDATASGGTYNGASADVSNDSGGTLSPGVSCLQDLTVVT